MDVCAYSDKIIGISCIVQMQERVFVNPQSGGMGETWYGPDMAG